MFYYSNYELLKSRTLAERAVEDMGLRKASSATAAEATSKPTSNAEAQLTAGSMLQDLFTRMRRGPAPVEIDPAVSRDNVPMQHVVTRGRPQQMHQHVPRIAGIDVETGVHRQTVGFTPHPEGAGLGSERPVESQIERVRGDCQSRPRDRPDRDQSRRRAKRR